MRGAFKRRESSDRTQTAQQSAPIIILKSSKNDESQGEVVVDAVADVSPVCKPPNYSYETLRESHSESPLRTDKEIAIHSLVKKSGVPNFLGCRIPALSNFNIQYIRQNATDYPDQEVIEFLEYGFPISYQGTNPNRTFCSNHKGAREFPSEIDSYLAKESKKGAILGPFDTNPFRGSNLTLSPLNSVPKSDTSKRRIILDLSYPPGEGINDGISREEFLGTPYKLTLPGVDDLCTIICKLRPGCLLWKHDLSRAYRQFPVDPGDVDKLGYMWRGKIYVDRVLAMGLRTAAICCQRATDLIRFMCTTGGHYEVTNYLDDIAGGSIPNEVVARQDFEHCGQVLRLVGAEESVEKACPPSTQMIHLGVLFNTREMTMEVTPQRVDETRREVDVWCSKEVATIKEVQSIVGKLQFVCKCVRQGRVFVSRVLNFLRDLSGGGSPVIPDEVRRDLLWFKFFLQDYNGVSVIPRMEKAPCDTLLASDSCLVGYGAVCEKEFCKGKFPDHIQALGLHISALEMLALIVAVKVWTDKFRGLRVGLKCDNEATVLVINSGKSRDPFMQACLRELCFVCAKGQFEVWAEHIPGVSNRLPDLLSRWYLGSGASEAFHRQTQGLGMREVYVEEDRFSFHHSW